MSVSMKAAKAAVVAALLSALLPTPGAAQGISGVMPNNCRQDLDWCSQKIWAKDSFPKRGAEQSIVFTNGETLTCISNGPNTRRTCKLTDNSGSQQQSSGDVSERCADLKQQHQKLADTLEALQPLVDTELHYLEEAIQMTPAELDSEIQEHRENINPVMTNASPIEKRYNYTVKQELNFLMDLRANKALGPELGTPTKQMQARAKKIVKDQQSWVNNQRQLVSREIQDVGDQISNLNCDKASSGNQSVDRPQSGK